MFSPIAPPEPLEHAGGAGEVDAGQVRGGERDVGQHLAVPGDHVDHTGRQSRLRQQVHQDRGRQLLAVGGFQTTVLPISAGAVGRLPAMAVKLNGVTA